MAMMGRGCGPVINEEGSRFYAPVPRNVVIDCDGGAIGERSDVGLVHGDPVVKVVHLVSNRCERPRQRPIDSSPAASGVGGGGGHLGRDGGGHGCTILVPFERGDRRGQAGPEFDDAVSQLDPKVRERRGCPAVPGKLPSESECSEVRVRI